MSSRRSKALAPIPIPLNSRYENHGNLRDGNVYVTFYDVALGDCQPL